MVVDGDVEPTIKCQIQTQKTFDHRALREWGVMKGWDVMTTPNQPTFPQICSFLEYLKKQNISVERFQNFYEAGDLIVQMLNCLDLSRVDRTAFTALLIPKFSIPWTPVIEYADRIMRRSKLRGWGFIQADADKLAAKLLNHAGDLYPTSVSLWLGKDLKFNYPEILLWIKDEVEALGYKFTEYFDVDRVSFFSGSEISGKRSLEPCYLDIETFWDKVNGIVAKDTRPNRKKWPSLEVLVLLALNPQVYIMMNGETVPYMLSAGLVVDFAFLPYFNRFSHGVFNRRVYVDERWVVARWYNATMVAFRKC